MSTDAKARFEEECRTRRSVQGRSEGRESFATKLKEEISRFNPYCEQITYTTLGCFAGTLRAVLNDGPAGIGKSRSTVGLAGLLPRIGARVISGQISPLALYKLLHECRSSRAVVIVDESFTLLADSVNQQMLRCALYSGTVEWRSQGDTFKALKLPESFRFSGRIIFNTNATNETNPNHKAMLDRVYYNKLVLTGEQVATKMIQKHEYTPNTAIWRAVEERLLQIRTGKVKTRLSSEEKKTLLQFTVHGVLQISRTYNTNLSVRILERVETLCLFLKQMFGTLDLEFAKSTAKHYFVINDEEDFIKKVIAEAGGKMAAKDLAVILRDTQKCSLRTAQRRIQEYVELGRIVVPKRGYVALVPVKRPRSPTPRTTPAPPTPREPTPVELPTQSSAASQEAWDDFCGRMQDDVSPVSPR